MLSDAIRDRLTAPVICPPMFLVSGPDLVREACLQGFVGALPRQNARSMEEFEGWLQQVTSSLDAARAEGRRVGPLAANFAAKYPPEVLDAELELLGRYGVDIVITANGNPAETVKRVHDRGGVVWHDVTSIRFAEKAIAGGVDGLTCIGAGGGGHSGTVSHLALIPKVRSMFDGVIIAAGAIATGAAVRAAEVLGADLAYMGTRFIATEESMASEAYKQMLVDADSTSLRYTTYEGGVPANWLLPSLAERGVSAEVLTDPKAWLPDGLKYWSEVWSGGQAVELISDVPSVAELAGRIRLEYIDACATPNMADVARLAEQALESRA
ncbi:MAG: nitronate monooxygenase [Microbacterium sp.]